MDDNQRIGRGGRGSPFRVYLDRLDLHYGRPCWILLRFGFVKGRVVLIVTDMKVLFKESSRQPRVL